MCVCACVCTIQCMEIVRKFGLGQTLRNVLQKSHTTVDANVPRACEVLLIYFDVGKAFWEGFLQ